jgi:hypothetical protein
MTPYRWLDRRIAAAGPFLTLCLSEQEFYHALSKIKVADRPAWVNPGAHATTHHRSGIEIAGLLIHEAVHVWQEYCDMIGEVAPGREQEAYAVQVVAQELMAEFKRRTVK